MAGGKLKIISCFYLVFFISISSDSEFVPAAPFYKIEAIIRPWRLTYVAKVFVIM